MKKFAIGAVILAVSLSLFPPALASAETTSPVSTDTEITAPTVTLTADSPIVTTEPAPIAEPVAEPLAEPVTVVAEPVAVPVATVATAPVAEPVTAPITAPVVAPTPVATAPIAPVATAPEATVDVAPEVLCMEDSPCWNCAEMGNHICGRDEGYNLAMTQRGWDLATAVNRYGTLQPVVAEHREGYLYIPSAVNPAYVYVFSLTTAEMEAGLSK